MQNPIIEWRRLNQQGQPQPYSTIFDDVYYSSDNGLLETDYVFLQGNQLAQRWQMLSSNSFTIAKRVFSPPESIFTFLFKSSPLNKKAPRRSLILVRISPTAICSTVSKIDNSSSKSDA